jgi:hypothetical protein
VSARAATVAAARAHKRIAVANPATGAEIAAMAGPAADLEPDARVREAHAGPELVSVCKLV